MHVDYSFEFGLEKLNRHVYSGEGADSNDVQSDPPQPEKEAEQESKEIEAKDTGDKEDLEGQEGCGGGTACYASSSFRNPPKGMSQEAYEKYKERHPEVEVNESLESFWNEEELLKSLESACAGDEDDDNEESIEMKLEKAAKKAVKQAKKSAKLQKKSDKMGEKAEKKFGKVQNKVEKVGNKINKKLNPEDAAAAERMKKKHKQQAMEEYYRRHPEMKKKTNVIPQKDY